MRQQKQNKLTPRRYKRISLVIICLITGAIGAWLTFGTFATTERGTGAPFQIISAPGVKRGSTITVPVALKNVPSGGPYYIGVYGVLGDRKDGSAIFGFTSCTIKDCTVPKKATTFNSGFHTCLTIKNAPSLLEIGSVSYLDPSVSLYSLTFISQRYQSLAQCLKTPYGTGEYTIPTTNQILFINKETLPNAADEPMLYVDRAGCEEMARDGKSDFSRYHLCEGFTASTKSTTPKDKGTGKGNTGNGEGTGGTGKGKNGTGSGGGGSSATKQGEKPKPTPRPAPQGAKETDPQQQEPSPFFDGKQYSVGSDPDAQTPADLITNPGKVFVNIWFYPIAGLVLIGLGVGGWFGWKKWRSMKAGIQK